MKRAFMMGALVCAMAAPANADVVDTFKALCLPNLGNPKNIEASAKQVGFKRSEMSDLFGGFMGERKKTDETVQVNIATKNSFECAVTTSDVADPASLRVRFFESLGLKTNKSQAVAKVGGQSYTFKFDTQGGEALVVYRK